ncbi:helix-turn-helix domain-containing protein [Streptomyces sp. NBC_01310]|uniref:helix-turn-helix domain-containing protein n=1 Tax=Streptomyces sp. NBC_01310 TaxID=2903820 RepID=UPI0035B5746F|nr:helix-turn-helix domain-containing protein [Streptomyces sp. NBC_01310]
MLEQPAFGQRLRALRRERGLSQAALAAGGLSTGYLSRLESGTRPPTRRVVEHLTRRLGLPASAFARGSSQSLSQALAVAMSSARIGPVADELAVLLHAGEDRLDPALRWQSLWLLASVRAEEARYEDEHELLVELGELSEAIGIPELTVRARIRLSRCCLLLGNTSRAHTEAREAHRLAAGLSVDDRSAALHALIRAEAEAGRSDEARSHARELYELHLWSPRGR